LQTATEVVNVTQDPSLLDVFEFDVALPEIADIQGTPITWMATDQSIAQKRNARAQAQQRQEAIQAAPAQAAMLKAGVAAKQAGVDVNQGQPQGGPPGQPGPGAPQ
ncbi:MAG: hypothetical protein ACHQ7M_17490, partial [Chloroflexota bacterium]